MNENMLETQRSTRNDTLPTSRELACPPAVMSSKPAANVLAGDAPILKKMTREQPLKGYGPILQSAFFSMARPMLWIQLLMGKTPYYVHSGWMRFSYKSLPFFYSVGVAISYVILELYYRRTLFKAWDELERSESTSYEGIMFSSMVLMQIPMFFVIIYSWFREAPAIVRCYNMTAVVEKRICEVFPTSALSARTRTIVTCSVVLYFVGVLIIAIILLHSRFNQAPLFSIMTFVFMFMLSHSICIAWCFNFLFVRCLARNLRQHMILCLQVEENRVCKLKICRKMWMTVWQLSRKYAGAFSVTLLAVLINNGLIFVISSYGIIDSVRTHSVMEIVSSLPYFVTSFFNVASVFETAHRAKNNLGDKFLRTLMAMDKDTLDSESVEEIDRFMSMISYTDNAKITLKGFVTVDRGLLVSFLSYSVTYLIVLIQFQGKIDDPTDGASSNGTET